MKTIKYLFVVLLVISTQIAKAQIPNTVAYQAVLADNNGEALINNSVQVRFSIEKNNSTVYVEEHQVTTNEIGKITLLIGNGTILEGDWDGISWAEGGHNIDVAIDYGQGFSNMGLMPLNSVFYAFSAETALTADSIKGIDLSNLGDDQQLILSGNFLQIENGNSVDLSNLIEDADADPTNEIQALSISNDTVYLENGGFIVLPENVHAVITDSDNNTKIQVEENVDEDVIRFDVDGSEVFRIKKNPNGVTVFENPSNVNTSTFFGEGAGTNISTGQNNSVFGKNAGESLAMGSNNTFVGRYTGQSNTDGLNNTFIGASSGRDNNGSGNVFIGYDAGRFATGSNLLYLENSASLSSPLIYGEFDNDLVKINGELKVTENLQVGFEGTPLSSIVKVSIQRLITSIPASSLHKEIFSVSGAEVGGAVHISPEIQLPENIVIAYSRVSSDDTVEVGFKNVSSNPSSTLSNIFYHIVVIN